MAERQFCAPALQARGASSGKYFPPTYCLERAAQCGQLVAQTAFPNSTAVLLELADRCRAMAAGSLGDDFKQVGAALHPPLGEVI
jgi:hypothetical protein